MTAYTQTWSNVEARIGFRAKAGQIAGNFNTLIMLRVKEMATAELLTDQLPEVRVVSTVVASSVTDTNDPADFADFASRNEDRILTESAPTLSPSDLVQLPKGQAFALIHGGLLYKIRIPFPDGSHDPMMPENIAAIGRELKNLVGVDSRRSRQRDSGREGHWLLGTRHFTKACSRVCVRPTEVRVGSGLGAHRHYSPRLDHRLDIRVQCLAGRHQPTEEHPSH